MSDEQVRVACPRCGKRFRVDPASVPEGPEGNEARCRGCGSAFVVCRQGETLRAAPLASEPPSEAPAPGPAPRRRRRRPRAREEHSPSTGDGRRRPASTGNTDLTTGSRSPSRQPAFPPSGETARPSASGDRVGRYEIEAVLARGGMGSIFKAYDPAANRHVALKVLSSTATELDRLRFQREIQVQGNIQHPHIMPIFDSGVIGTDAVLHDGAAEEPAGPHHAFRARHAEARRPRIRACDPCPRSKDSFETSWCPSARRSTTRTRTRACSTATSSLATSCWTATGSAPFVIDFGVSALLEKKNARLAHLDRELPVPLKGKGVHVTGTLVFMPPEQARGRADRRGDVWALGAMLHYLVTGEPPLRPPVAARRQQAGAHRRASRC